MANRQWLRKGASRQREAPDLLLGAGCFCRPTAAVVPLNGREHHAGALVRGTTRCRSEIGQGERLDPCSDVRRRVPVREAERPHPHFPADDEASWGGSSTFTMAHPATADALSDSLASPPA